jgi:rhamnosyl/mannosyltransferase
MTGSARERDDGTNAAVEPVRGDTLDVLQVGKYYHPQVGGVERVVRRLAEGLSERGHRARVLVARPRGLPVREDVDGVPVRRTGTLGSLLSVPVAPGFPVALHEARRGADVIHYHLPNPLAVLSHLALPDPDAVVVVTHHGDVVRQSAAMGLYRPLLNRFLDGVDHGFVSAPAMLDADHVTPLRDRLSVAPLTIPLAEFPADPSQESDLETATTTDGGHTERDTVLFVGRLSWFKGIEVLVEAMASVDADLVVVGDGERSTAAKERVAALELEDRVHLLGHVSERRLHRLYDAADVFVLPAVARSESFGIVQLEAMAHGTPVVNTDLPTGVPWVSRDGETGLTVPPDDADALAAALRRLLEDDKRRERYGQAARRRVEQRFAEPRLLDTVETTYKRLHRRQAAVAGS